MADLLRSTVQRDWQRRIEWVSRVAVEEQVEGGSAEASSCTVAFVLPSRFHLDLVVVVDLVLI